MRDIEKYGEDYKTKNNFEAVQVSYRRKKVLECLNNVTPPPYKYWKLGAAWSLSFYSIKILQNILLQNHVLCSLKMHNSWQNKIVSMR